MKKVAIAAVLAAMTPMAAQADLLFTVGAKASVWDAEPTGQLDDGISVEDDGLNLDSENGQQLTVFFEHPVPLIPNVKLMRTSLELEGEGNIDGEFAGTPFDEDVASTFDLSHNDLTLIWGLPLPIPFVDFNFGLTARQFDGVAEVTGAVAGTESVDLDFTMPLLYGEVKVDTPFGIYGQLDVNYIAYGDNEVQDLSYGIGYTLPIPLVDLGLEAGYRSLSLKTDEDLADIEADADIKGTYVGASLSVGF